MRIDRGARLACEAEAVGTLERCLACEADAFSAFSDFALSSETPEATSDKPCDLGDECVIRFATPFACTIFPLRRITRG